MRVLCNMAEIIQLLWEEPIEIKVGQRGGDRAKRARFLTKVEASFFLQTMHIACGIHTAFYRMGTVGPPPWRNTTVV